VDARVYATVAKAELSLSPAAFTQREDELRATVPPESKQTVFSSHWIESDPEPWRPRKVDGFVRR
jgi:hypothetical protein